MSASNKKLTTLMINPDKISNYNLKSVLTRYFFHWPLFVICIAAALAAASIYLKIAKPTYLVRATILIKDNKQSAGGAKTEIGDDIGFTNSTEGVENEMEILRSKKLIGKVVDDLQLWITYKKKNGWLFEDIYNQSPVKLTLLNVNLIGGNNEIDIQIKDDRSFLLKGTDGKYEEVSFENSYAASFGRWQLQPTKTLADCKGDFIIIRLANPEKTTQTFQNAINVGLTSKQATSIDISIFDQVPARGEDVLNDLISNYNLFSATDQDQETKSTLDFLNKRIDSLSKELTASEKGIEGFKSSNSLTDMSSDAQVRLQNMQANDNELNQVNLKLNVVDGIEKYLNSNQNEEKAPATVGITDPALSNSIEALAQLQLQHDKLAATMPETNPDFDPINSQIKTAKATIRENVKNIKESLMATRQKLESFAAGYEASIKGMPEEERQYVSIKRQQTSKESLYTYLLQKREEVNVKYASTLSNDRVIDKAYAEPANDISSIAYFIAFLIGFGFPLTLIYGRNSLKNRVTNIDQITGALKLPVIAELPMGNFKSMVVVSDGQMNMVSEQFKALRVKLFQLHKSKGTGRVTLITSSVPNEGKSFVSVNLGLALALAFKKTIILELDMRKPKIAESLGLAQKHAGISEYLNGKATRSAIIQSSGSNPNLDLITRGAVVHNPSELLEKRELEELITSLREEYDDIIIDSPPIHLVADAVILSRMADLTLYIIRQGVTHAAELEFINQLAEQQYLHNINILFNGIERIKYGYGYKYDERYYNAKKSDLPALLFADFKNRF